MNTSDDLKTIHLFPELNRRLQEVLTSLTIEQWESSTTSPRWTIKDIAAHLLDGNIRTLSILKDNYRGDNPGQISPGDDLLKYLNRLNDDWVKAMRRTSPRILIELLMITGVEYDQFLASLDPAAPAAFAVAWAGETVSTNNFHIAREYTEKWHHQQQIRLAVGKEEPLFVRELYSPYLNTSMRALPYHLRDIIGKDGETLLVTIQGPAGGEWLVCYHAGQWRFTPASGTPHTTVTLDEKIAWRIFSKQLAPADASKVVVLEGNLVYADKIRSMVAVMA